MKKKIVDFGFGVIFSGKEKVKRKLHKWAGIVRNPAERKKWEHRLTVQGYSYRQELINRLQEKTNAIKLQSVDKSNKSMPVHRSSATPVSVGQKIKFCALDKGLELEGIVTLTSIDPTGEFFILQALGVDGQRGPTYICRDCGDRFIGDVEF